VVLPGVHASPEALFFCGALLFPPFLMQQDVVVRAGLILVFMLLTALAGKRVRLLQSAVVAACIVLFNLVIPTGKVLAAPLGLLVTEGALKGGLMKATAMTGLISLSQFSIRPSLRLPGRFGGLVGRSFFYFEAIMSERRTINRRDIIGSIDALLLSVGTATQSSFAGSASSAVSPRQGVTGYVVLVLLVAAHWGLFAFTVVHPRLFWGG
jgi:hypothetical protein